MRGLGKGAVAICVLVTALFTAAAWAQGGPPKTPKWLPDHNWSGQWCRYPGSRPKSAEAATQAAIRTTVINEIEPNDVYASAQVISIAPGPMDPVNLDIRGSIGIGEDVDLFRFRATKGDIIGAALIADGGSSLDCWLAIQQINGVPLLENDDNTGFTTLYPAKSPFPSGQAWLDSCLTWIAPADGDYLIAASSYYAASRGEYVLQIRARRPSFENQNLGSTQIIFLDMDGATLNAPEIFHDPSARNPANMSPLWSFLPNWGLLAPEDAAAVTQAIIDSVQERINALRLASLNGNRATDLTAGHFDIVLLNSRDHADPWGQPNVSRVIIGGTGDQLGMYGLYGISQSIDPGNFDREETCVVMLDMLSLDKTQDVYPGGPYSINSLDVSGAYTKIDLIGQTIASIAVHEMGHYLGNWHTDSQDEVPCIMDTGGNPLWYMAGIGPDAIMGTADDIPIEFVPDVFDPGEYVAMGEELTDVNSAFAFATGRVTREIVTPPGDPTYPQVSIRATPTAGSPPLTVEFWAGVVDDASGDATYSWDFADGSEKGTGPVTTHVFNTPGEFLVKVTASNGLGNVGQASVLIMSSALLPTAKVVADPLRGAAPLTVSFDGRGSTATGTIVNYAWSFGDTVTATGATVQHTYVSAGYYAAQLTVTDSNGGQSTASSLITVNAPSTTAGFNASQSQPSLPASPQCALGSGVAAVGSLAGLCVLMALRRRN